LCYKIFILNGSVKLQSLPYTCVRRFALSDISLQKRFWFTALFILPEEGRKYTVLCWSASRLRFLRPPMFPAIIFRTRRCNYERKPLYLLHYAYGSRRSIFSDLSQWLALPNPLPLSNVTRAPMMYACSHTFRHDFAVSHGQVSINI